jgi:alpha/beta superfamily hydrolase
MSQSDLYTPLAATRIEADGPTELVEFRGPEGERMLTHLHLPATASPRAGVVICSPVLGEFVRNYRREVLLGRWLAERGFAALRFHYRFSGNSDGGDEGLTFETMRQDALTCMEHIRDHVADGPLFLVGTRWGALVAASAAAGDPEAGLVLWEPWLDAAGFFKAAFRNQLVRARRDGDEDPPTTQQLQERLLNGQAVEVAAHLLMPGLYRSSIGRSVEEELGASQRPILAVQIGPTGSVRPEMSRLAERWGALGHDVQASAVKGEESWWLVEERMYDEAKRPMTKELLSLTIEWIDGHSRQGGNG